VMVFFFFFWSRVLWTICLGLASNCNFPDLCLLSSWDSRCEPPAPGQMFLYSYLYDFSLHALYAVLTFQVWCHCPFLYDLCWVLSLVCESHGSVILPFCHIVAGFRHQR
jgi:hypothetical protein